MDLNKRNGLKVQNNMSEQVEEDRITNLPDSLLHYILSLALLDIKEVARTSILSKRWYYIWISTPTLDLRSLANPPIYWETSKFMDTVDRILHLHDMSSIQKLSLRWNHQLNETRVSLWISAAIRRSVEELSLTLYLNSTFCTPLSLCTSQSLVTLELDIFPNLYLPKYMSFPKLKHFKLSRVTFSDKYNNELFFSSCPVLENLTLENCKWFDMKNFCLSTPSLKVLNIRSYDPEKEYCHRIDGLRHCALEIQAPNLVSLTYWGDLAKEYVMSNFLSVVEVDVRFGYENYKTSMKSWADQGAKLSKFLQALSHVKCLTVSDRTLQVLLSFFGQNDLAYNFPIFHNLKKLNLTYKGEDIAVIALLQSTPNLESLVFCEIYDGEGNYGYNRLMTTARGLFLHLKSVCFKKYYRNPSEMKWVRIILQNAADLETMIFPHYWDVKRKKQLVMDLTSLPRLSESCVFEFSA